VVPPATEDAAETETGVPGESGPARSRSSDGAVTDGYDGPGVLTPLALAAALARPAPLPAEPVEPRASALRLGLRAALAVVAAARGGGAE
jgi:hypothetical protein